MKDEKPRWVSCSTVQERIYYSKSFDADEYPKFKTIWVGHPAIARLIVRVLNWWTRKTTPKDTQDE